MPMPRPPPPLTWFRAFEASARHLSFTAAARELHLTQSAVSQQVRSLEIRFNVSLFQRLPRGLAITDEGRRLLPDVSAALGTLAGISHNYEQNDVAAHLTAAVSVSFIQWVITPGMQTLLAKHPGFSLRLISTVWPDDFKTANADVEIRFGSETTVGEGAQRLLPDDLIVVASPTLAVDPDNLRDHPLIATVGTSDGWSDWAKAVSYKNILGPTVYVDYHGAALDLAISGAGIALTSSLLAARSLADGSLVQIRDESLPSKEGYFLAETSRKMELVDIFTGWLKEELAAG